MKTKETVDLVVRATKEGMEVVLDAGNIHALGYDGCGAHTHKGDMICSATTSVDDILETFLHEGGRVSELFLEVKPVLSLDADCNKPLFFVRLNTTGKALYQMLVSRNVDEALAVAQQLVQRIATNLERLGHQAMDVPIQVLNLGDQVAAPA